MGHLNGSGLRSTVHSLQSILSYPGDGERIVTSSSLDSLLFRRGRGGFMERGLLTLSPASDILLS